MNFSYEEPTTLNEAVGIMAKLRAEGKKVKYLSGGTDLFPLLKRKVIQIDTVINLKHIEGLDDITEDAGYLRIGSLVPLNEVAKSLLVQKWAPAVSTAADKAATPGIRNMGTAGGNILQTNRCWYYNQPDAFRAGVDPCYARGGQICHKTSEQVRCTRILMSELIPPLVVNNASLILVSSNGSREIELKSLINPNVGVVNIKQTEIIAEIKIPKHTGLRKESYQRMAARNAIDYPAVSVAVGVNLDQNGKTCTGIEVVIGSVCCGPFKSSIAESLAGGKTLDAVLGDTLANAVVNEIEPNAVESHEFPKWYQLDIAKKMIRDTIYNFCGITEGGECIG